MTSPISKFSAFPKRRLQPEGRSSAFRFHVAICFSATLLLTACEEEAEKIEELEKEVSLLKSSLRDLKDRVQGESDRTDNFTQRIETTEQQSKDAIEQASNAVMQQADRFKRVERGIAQIAKNAAEK